MLTSSIAYVVSHVFTRPVCVQMRANSLSSLRGETRVYTSCVCVQMRADSLNSLRGEPRVPVAGTQHGDTGQQKDPGSLTFSGRQVRLEPTSI